MEDRIETQHPKNKKAQKKHASFDSDLIDSNDNPTNDTDSLYSGSFTSKHSPEYSSGEYEEKTIKSKIPPIIRKGIHKYYEPINDCGTLFRYEDNPNEYKKARKRIQNRESASRVRNRKKTYIEELEQEMDIMKRENEELKMRLAQFEAENNLLKSQNNYIEKVSYSSPQEDSSQVDPCGHYFVTMNEIKEEDEFDPLGSPQQEMDFIRYPSNSFSTKNHITLLGIFTLIICAFGVIKPDGHENSHTVLVDGKPVATHVDFGLAPRTNYLGLGLLFALGTGYVLYLIYTMNLLRLKYFSGKKKSGRVSI